MAKCSRWPACPLFLSVHELLDRLKITHDYEVVPGVAHNSTEHYKKLDVKGFEFHRKTFELVMKGK